MPPRLSRGAGRAKETPVSFINVDEEEEDVNGTRHLHHDFSHHCIDITPTPTVATISTASSPPNTGGLRLSHSSGSSSGNHNRKEAHRLSSSAQQAPPAPPSPPPTHRKAKQRGGQQQPSAAADQSTPPCVAPPPPPFPTSTPVELTLTPSRGATPADGTAGSNSISTTTATTAVPAVEGGSYLDGLDEHQREAVCADPDRPLLLQAGAGSGKTHTMASRVVHLIVHHHVPPHRVLCFCFTRQAAFTLQHRVEQLLQREMAWQRGKRARDRAHLDRPTHGEVARETQTIGGGGGGSRAAGGIKIKTMHAFGLECLREYGYLPRGTEVIDTKRQRQLARQVVEQHLGLHKKPSRESRQQIEDHIYALVSFVNAQKNSTTRSFGPNAPENMIVMFKHYERLLHDEMLAVDFGDLQYMFYEMLRPQEVAPPAPPATTTPPLPPMITPAEEGEGKQMAELMQAGASSGGSRLPATTPTRKEMSKVCMAIRRRYTHVIIDEFQDLNEVQFEIAALLAGDVDEDQANTHKQEEGGKRNGPPDDSKKIIQNNDGTHDNNNNNNNNNAVASPPRRYGVCHVSCVGDPNQCIYVWRGAVRDAFVRWQRRFPQSLCMSLLYNYRSLPHVVRVANRIVRACQQSVYALESGRKRLLPQPPQKEETETAEDEEGTAHADGHHEKRWRHRHSGHLDMSALVTLMDKRERLLKKNIFSVKIVHTSGSHEGAMHLLQQLLRITCANVYTDEVGLRNKQILFSLPRGDSGTQDGKAPVPCYNYDDIAILCRTGKEVNRVVQLLKDSYLPHQLIRHVGSTNRNEGGPTSAVALVMALLRLIAMEEDGTTTTTTTSAEDPDKKALLLRHLPPLQVSARAHDTHHSSSSHNNNNSSSSNRIQHHINTNNNNNNVNHSLFRASLRQCNEDIRTIISYRPCPKLSLAAKHVEPFMATLESLVEERRQKEEVQRRQQQQPSQQGGDTEFTFYDTIKDFVFCNFSASAFPKLSSFPKAVQKSLKNMVALVEEGRQQLRVHEQHSQQQRSRAHASACSSAEPSLLRSPATEAKLRVLHQCGLLLQQLLRHVVVMAGLDGDGGGASHQRNGRESAGGTNATKKGRSSGGGKRTRAGDNIVNAVAASFCEESNANSSKSNGCDVGKEQEEKENAHHNNKNSSNGNIDNNNNDDDDDRINSNTSEEDEGEERKTLLSVLLQVLEFLQAEREQEIEHEEKAELQRTACINEEEEAEDEDESIMSTRALLLRFLDQFILLSEDDDDTNALLRSLMRQARREEVPSDKADMTAAQRRSSFGPGPTPEDGAREDALLPDKESLLKRHFRGRTEHEKQARGKISVGTVHAAKGMEWPLVFLPGCNVGGFPIYTSHYYGSRSVREDGGAVVRLGGCNDEERRIFYVAMSRAQSNVIAIMADDGEQSVLIHELLESARNNDGVEVYGDCFPVQELVCKYAPGNDGLDMHLVQKEYPNKKKSGAQGGGDGDQEAESTARNDNKNDTNDRADEKHVVLSPGEETQRQLASSSPPPPPTTTTTTTTISTTAAGAARSQAAVQWIAPGDARVSTSRPRRTTMTYKASQ